MRFDTPLVPARLIRRYKRFLADFTLEDGREITAHCANPGSMMGLKEPGLKAWLEPNDNPKKKLKFGWRLVDHENGHFTGVDTGLPNRMLKTALQNRALPELAQYSSVRAEVPYAEGSRVDFLLSEDGLPKAYVEVKSVTLSREAGLAEFPDSVTARGAKHMLDLAGVAQAGHRAVVLFLAQRTDCHEVEIAKDIDSAYGEAFRTALSQGVQVIAYSFRISPEGVWLGQAMPVRGEDAC